MAILFVTGIDTGIGKTYATGLLGLYLKQQGRSVITAKLAQTGVKTRSEDIELHRQLMNMPWLPEDESGLTCPYVFPFPASPHLSAALAGQQIDPTKIKTQLSKLQNRYETVLLEGVGGLYVPLVGTYTVLDFIAEQKLSAILVSSSKLGSINHTLLSLEALVTRAIPIKGLVYNLHTPVSKRIMNDSQTIFKSFYPQLPLVPLPSISPDKGTSNLKLDFSSFNM